MRLGIVLATILLPSGQAALAAGEESDLLPDTPAGRVFRAFVAAYNDGSRAEIATFVAEHYSPAADVVAKTDDWLELRCRYGPLRVHGVSIDEDRDLEMWMYGTVTRAWIAIELILDDAEHVRAVGLLQGEEPASAPRIEMPETELPDHLDRYLGEMTEAGYFAGTVRVSRMGHLVYEGAFGLASQEDDVPMRIDTRLQLASVTKVFTGVAIAQLAAQGKLSLGDPIGTYIPEYPPDIGAQVTIRHLLTHTSGIELDEIPAFNDAKRRAETSAELLEAHLAHIDSLRVDGQFELPHRFDYTNEGYDLAGIIVERVSGKSLLQYFTDDILTPAGMSDTGWYPARSFDESIALGYTHYEYDDDFSEQEVPNNYVLARSLFGSSGLYSTVRDLDEFADALFRTDRLLTPAMRDSVVSPRVSRGPGENQGYGVELLTTKSGFRSIGHNGGNRGISAEFRYYPASEYCVVVLSSKRTIAVVVSNYIRDALGLN
ncbi:MAG: serine hydrolase [Candidatus Eisenbacteria bacterium]|uniref:Serine hydrolase n=1 Tax=Eiseniibacteriota bacterium TaxID=2212470 RepID=A0A956SCZ9_UNCEI|nr:serine hydrolase [Candidatus Eisenbacteria bacterium]